MCSWGEAYVLGPNINAPGSVRGRSRSRSDLTRQGTRGRCQRAREALIAALDKRYSADPRADRAALDRAYADAMAEVAARFPGTSRSRPSTPMRS